MGAKGEMQGKYQLYTCNFNLTVQGQGRWALSLRAGGSRRRYDGGRSLLFGRLKIAKGTKADFNFGTHIEGNRLKKDPNGC